MITVKKPLILASKSPRRKQILELADIPNEIFVIETDEQYDASISVTDIPVSIAKGKLNAVKAHFGLEDRYILAADTIVELNGEIIGKPKDADNAFQTLKKLSGKVHSVITGVALYTPSKEFYFSEKTLVHFNELSNEEIAYYIEKYEPFDKAGAYAIQEWIGAVGIQKIDGDYYNVVGLPINKIIPLLH